MINMSFNSRKNQGSRSSGTPSILKKPKSLKNRLNEMQQTPTRVKFVLPHTQKVQSILEGYIFKQESRDYENILCLIRDAHLTDEDVSSLLKEATECISILSKDLRLFVEAILSIEWSNKSEYVVTEYQSFIVNLLSAHNYHAKLVIEKLVRLFLPEPTESEWSEGIPTERDHKKCDNVHNLFKLLLEVIPMCKELFMNTVCNQFPYYNKSTHIQEYYVYNVLRILRYQPVFRPLILELLFKKLIIMDVNAPREEIEKYKVAEEELFLMDDDSKSFKTSTTCFTQVNRHELAHTLDICLAQIFDYLYSESYNSDSGDLDINKFRRLFDEMLTIFEHIILPTYDTHHVQYVLFYICSFKPFIAEGFIHFLWKFSCNPNKPPVLRQAAVNYLASFAARATFVTSSMLKSVLESMANWIHSYILAQDELGPVNSDVRIHRVFYSICQALFYIVAFRHKAFVKKKKNITFLENLNMGRIVASKLNPLRVCQPAVVQNFAAITRNYQLVYCYTVIEHNTRNKIPTIYQSEQGAVVTSDNILDAVFPFDPCVLERSYTRIQPIYREFQELIEVADKTTSMETDTKEMDVDDFLYNGEVASSSGRSRTFSYSSSPGFKFKM